MIGTGIGDGFDRDRRARSLCVSQVALDFCHRQIVVPFAEQQQDRRSGIGPRFCDRAEDSGRIIRDMRGKPGLPRIKRGMELLEGR